MDLKLMGKSLADAVASLERRENILGINEKGIEFPVFISLYSYHCGLRPPSTSGTTDPLDHDEGAFWLPTVHGEWKKVLCLHFQDMHVVTSNPAGEALCSCSKIFLQHYWQAAIRRGSRKAR